MWWRSTYPWAQGGWGGQGGPKYDQGSQGYLDHGQKHHFSSPRVSARNIRFWPGFCESVNPSSFGYDWLISSPSLSLRSQLSNKTSCKPFGDHLTSQPAQNFQLCSTGLNPAQGRNGFLLGNDPWTIESELLGFDCWLKYLSNHVAKAQGKDHLLLLLSSLSTPEIPSYPGKVSRLSSLVYPLAFLIN